MQKLFHTADTASNEVFKTLPQAVQLKIKSMLTIIDTTYGLTRNVEVDSGGYVVILETLDDLHQSKSILHLDFEKAVFEYVDAIDGYLGCQYLIGCDFNIYFILKTDSG
ncbi:hypothetical protein Q5O14_01835 [Eubacteriaceae bacterium ES2]|nr:hypothetical protein Q5O14_01835 [Eubacteriaceae bacterium ES2]